MHLSGSTANDSLASRFSPRDPATLACYVEKAKLPQFTSRICDAGRDISPGDPIGYRESQALHQRMLAHPLPITRNDQQRKKNQRRDQKWFRHFAVQFRRSRVHHIARTRWLDPTLQFLHRNLGRIPEDTRNRRTSPCRLLNRFLVTQMASVVTRVRIPSAGVNSRILVAARCCATSPTEVVGLRNRIPTFLAHRTAGGCQLCPFGHHSSNPRALNRPTIRDSRPTARVHRDLPKNGHSCSGCIQMNNSPFGVPRSPTIYV